MSLGDDSPGEMHDIDLTDELLKELNTVDGDPVAVTAFLLELRGRYGSHELPAIGGVLAQMLDVGLSPEGATNPSQTTRRTTMINRAAAFVKTTTGRVALGLTLALASVGTAQAAGVVDLPGLPSPQDPAVIVPSDDSNVDVDPPTQAEPTGTDVDDGQIDNTDNGQVNNTDNGQVNNTDDGQVNNTDDGQVNNTDDGGSDG